MKKETKREKRRRRESQGDSQASGGGGFKAEESGEVLVDEGGRGCCRGATWWRRTPPTPLPNQPSPSHAARCLCFCRAGQFGTARGGERPSQESCECAGWSLAQPFWRACADHGTNVALRTVEEVGSRAFRSQGAPRPGALSSASSTCVATREV